VRPKLAARLAAAALLGLWSGPSLAASIAADTVILQGLDKITARVTAIEAPVGKPVTFGSLSITARHCEKNPPEEAPEAAAFLEIVDAKPGEAPVKLFSGWMFASSPAVSALEHPVYDVWVIDCKNTAKSGAATSP
jgi:hypothetical protein